MFFGLLFYYLILLGGSGVGCLVQREWQSGSICFTSQCHRPTSGKVGVVRMVIHPKQNCRVICPKQCVSVNPLLAKEHARTCLVHTRSFSNRKTGHGLFSIPFQVILGPKGPGLVHIVQGLVATCGTERRSCVVAGEVLDLMGGTRELQDLLDSSRPLHGPSLGVSAPLSQCVSEKWAMQSCTFLFLTKEKQINT